jgi:hypothetical protein
MSLNRRAFLKQATATAAALGAARLAPAIATPDSPGQNDLMPLLIETDRDRLLEQLVARIRGGLDYPTLLGAIAEASVRQVRPYPMSASSTMPSWFCRPWIEPQGLAVRRTAGSRSCGPRTSSKAPRLQSKDREAGPLDPCASSWSHRPTRPRAHSGIISVHANTSVNALHYAYRHLSDPRKRQLMLLQAAAFLPLFRDLLGGERRRLRVDTLEALDQDEDPGSALKGVFVTVSVDHVNAARQTLGYLAAGGAEPPFMRLARRYVVERNTGYHDYKFAEAAFENAAAMQSSWRERYLAASVLYLNGSADKANETVRRARSLLG